MSHAAVELVDGLAVYRRSGPPGAARVVFVHGSMDRAAAFVRSIRRLPGIDAVRYDRRGYGRSVDAGLCPDLEAQVDDLERVLDGHPSVVVGHSLGGVVALCAAARRPNLVSAVVAYESPMAWRSWWPARSAGGAALDAQRRDAGPAEAAERFMRRIVGDEVWEALPDATHDRRRAEGPALLSDLRAIRTETAPYRPAELAMPIVAGHGSRSDAHHQRAAVDLAAEAPGGELVVIDGSGHAAPISHPAEFAALVHRALDRAGDTTAGRAERTP